MTDPFPTPTAGEVVDRLLAALADESTPPDLRDLLLAAARVVTQQSRDLDSLWQEWTTRLREQAS